MKKWINENPGLIVVICFALFLLVYIWTWMASPYNPQYWVKRALFTPQFVCRDSTYSWAKTQTGACSGHSGVLRKY